MIALGRLQRLLPTVCTLAAALLIVPPDAQAIPLLNGFGGPNGYGTPDHCVHPNDDGSYAGADGTGDPVAIDLRPAFTGGLRFFGRTFNSFFLNTNGNITFNAALFTYTPQPFPVAEQPMIAPWWADVDTRGGGQPTRNTICYHIEPNRIVITWNNVGYFNAQNNRLNDFQMVLSTSGTCTTGGDFDVEFRYNRCEWTTGSASGGNEVGLGGTPAQVGFDAGNRMNIVALPMSRTMAILDVCRTSNVPGGAPGLYRFQIRGGMVGAGCTGAGQPCTVAGQMGACGMGVTICSGMSTTCAQVNRPRPRSCNGFDNDCDGMIDEGNDLCPTNQVCDRGQCVERCQPELGCLTGRSCSDRGTCVETSCLDVTCPAGQRCAGGRCTGICDGVNCPWAQACRAGRCVNPCADVVCDGRDVCDGDPRSMTFGQCVPGCQCRPCAAGQTCQPDGQCTVDACTGVTCPSGAHCEEGTCRDSCATAPDTRLCPNSEVCRVGECVPGAMAPLDAGVAPTRDAGARADVGRVADAGRDAGRDSGARVDSGSNLRWTQGSTGCTCRVGVTARSPRWPFAAIALGAALALRRRRRSARR
jgi:MYXO-CTERM domain-containing protein